jgi:3-hydroxybutyryl-CoA dehydrogenase
MNTTDALSRDIPVAVIGLGTMGHGIAQAFAMGGYRVRAIDEQPETAATAVGRIGNNLNQLADAGLLKPDLVPDVLERITVCDSLEDTVEGTGWVTEAAWENLEAKQQLLARLEQLVDRQTILASNSSSFPITQTAADLATADRAIVTHWFNPPHVIPVVEVVGGERTSESTVVTTLATLDSIGKTAVRIDKELAGFLVNRVQVAMFREVFDLLDRGVATASEIDRAIRGSMGLRLAALGPLAIIDHAGWDISAATFANLISDMQSDTRIPDVIQQMLDHGQLGTKSGQGIYEYPAETIDQTVAQRDADYLSLVRLLHTCEDSE